MNRLAGTYLGWTYFPAGCTKGGGRIDDKQQEGTRSKD